MPHFGVSASELAAAEMSSARRNAFVIRAARALPVEIATLEPDAFAASSMRTFTRRSAGAARPGDAVAVGVTDAVPVVDGERVRVHDGVRELDGVTEGVTEGVTVGVFDNDAVSAAEKLSDGDAREETDAIDGSCDRDAASVGAADADDDAVADASSDVDAVWDDDGVTVTDPEKDGDMEDDVEYDADADKLRAAENVAPELARRGPAAESTARRVRDARGPITSRKGERRTVTGGTLEGRGW